MTKYPSGEEGEIYTAYGYRITDDPHFMDETFAITPVLHRKIERLYFESQEGDRGTIRELQQLITAHPRVPQLKNLLMGTYAAQGNMQKSHEVNTKILTEHPNYLFGKINEAFRRIQNGKIDAVDEVVGNHWDLKQLYPERTVFQVGEVLGFHKLGTFYFVQREDLQNAERQLSILKEVAPDHHDTEQAESFLFSLRMKAARDRWTAQKEKEIAVEVVNWPLDPPLGSRPVFHHAAIESLYKEGFGISAEKFQQLLELPRETLIVDLIAVLQDAVNRFYTYYDDGWDDETCCFPTHALWLLKEIDAKEALAHVLAFFEYDSEFLDFWFGDAITEDVWQCVFVFGKDQPEVLVDFLHKPGVDALGKCAVSEALAQIGLHYPDRRAMIVDAYQHTFEAFRDALPVDNLIDTRAITYLVGDAVDAGYQELLPIIEDLHRLTYVDESAYGDFQKLSEYMQRYAAAPRVREVESIYDFYQKETVESDDGLYDDEWNDMAFPQPVVSQKVGRNDPCPCGSGKKHKKCCGLLN